MCYFQVTAEEESPEVVVEENSESHGNSQQLEKTAEGNKTSTNQFKPPKSGYARSRQANTPILKEAVAVMREIQAKSSQNRDDYSVFGEHVANKIRKLSNPRTQTTVKHLICNMLFDAEMGRLDKPPRIYEQPHYPPHQPSTMYGQPSTSGRTVMSQSPSPFSSTVSHSPSDFESNYATDESEDIDRLLRSFQ